MLFVLFPAPLKFEKIRAYSDPVANDASEVLLVCLITKLTSIDAVVK